MRPGIYTASELAARRPEWVGLFEIRLVARPFERWTYLRRKRLGARHNDTLLLIRQTVRLPAGSIVGRIHPVKPTALCVLHRTRATLLQRLDDPAGPLFLW